MSNVLQISEKAREKAFDFIENERQFQLGFLPTEQSNPITATFERILSALESDAGRRTIAGQIEFEKGVYAAGGLITYLADRCMLDLFTDNTERAPTFMIPPLRSSPVQVALAALREESLAYFCSHVPESS